jgi:hypothetical protein
MQTSSGIHEENDSFEKTRKKSDFNDFVQNQEQKNSKKK